MDMSEPPRTGIAAAHGAARGGFAQIAASRLILQALVVVALVLVAHSAITIHAPEWLGQTKILTDFDAFYIAGTLAGRGDAADAYAARTMLPALAEVSATDSFMPWTYPPPFTLVMDAFARLPIGASYAIFALGTFGLYLAVLRKIAGPYLAGAVLLVLPVVILNLRTGQNGMLIAALVGLILLGWRDRKPGAGIPLGLMIIKPHLAAGVGLLALSSKRWEMIAGAAVVAGLALTLSTMAYGIEIWSAFGGAVREASVFLEKGLYPLFRMNSAYAALHRLGLPPAAAMSGHIVVALAALGLLGWACTARIAFPARAALICALSMFVSPYNYDYDLAVLGVAAAFLLPDLLEKCSAVELGGLLGLAWLACGYGLVTQIVSERMQRDGESSMAGASNQPSLTFFLLLAACAYAAYLMARPQRDDTTADAPQLPA